MKWIIATVTTLLLCAPVFAADVIISEIMYNPDSNEGKTYGQDASSCRTEWLEICNISNADVDISGWKLGDEDGSTGPVADGVTIKPGEAVVLIPAECGIEAFRAAWGDGFQVLTVTGWSTGGMRQLGNSPSDVNEILRLMDKDGNTVDTVNYDDEGDWPSDSPDGPSIYLKAAAMNADANDQGSSWARSTAGTDGAKANTQTEVFNGHDVGSPGTVPGAAPASEPSASE